MNIECILKREGGSVVDLGGIEYHFEPLQDGAHVADVAEETHIDRFLSISEGYKLYHGKCTPKGEPKQIGENTPVPASVAVNKTNAPLSGSNELPPQFEIDGKVITQLEAVQKAFEASGMTSDEWNELGQEERTAKIEIALDELADANDTTGEGEGDDLHALKAAYKERFGKPAHHTWTAEVITAKLNQPE